MSDAPPLVIVNTDEVRKVWPHVRDRVVALAANHDEAWLAEDVYLELARGGSYLWTTPDLEGFVVIQIHSTPFERDLHVWIACNRTDAPAGEFIPQLKDIAAEAQCDRVTWESSRKGWERAIPGVSVRYSLSVQVGGSDG